MIADLLKLSDETDLDILNHMMEVMVEQYSTELLPVASQLTARLVSRSYIRITHVVTRYSAIHTIGFSKRPMPSSTMARQRRKMTKLQTMIRRLLQWVLRKQLEL
jgi:hypothetical protein